MKSNDIKSALDFVAGFLEEGGVSNADIVLARKRGEELLNSQDVHPYEAARFVLDHLKTEFGITTAALDKDQEGAVYGALYGLKRISNTSNRMKALGRWLGIGKEREGD